MHTRRPGLATLVLLGTALIASGCAPDATEESAPDSSAATPSATPSPELCVVDATSLVPEGSTTMLGVNLDWGTERLVEFTGVLGAAPATAVVFTEFPLTDDNRANLLGAVDQIRAENSSLLITLEPREGLAAVTADVIADTAELLDSISATGVPVIVRYAHEMNGSWYAWGQQPEAYVASFRAVAAEFDERAPGVAMMWAPNYGGGYPFAGGEFETTAGEPGFELLDTNGDGVVTMADDPYAPYYPGDDVVDWVGMSLYHWGSAYPWGENEIAEPNKFVEQLRGDYNGLGGDDSTLPDFYGMYVEGAGKPLGIPETAAFVTADADPVLALEIKRSWWSQVFAPDLAAQLPGLAMINWFEWNKYEVEVDGDVDWTIGRDPAIAAAFVADLPDWVRFAPAEHRCA